MRRPLWHSPQDIPHGPGRLPTGTVTRVGAPRAPTMDVREINRYPFLTVLTFALVDTVPILAVTQADTTRIFLAVRNLASSLGTLFIGFGVRANADNATFILPPNGQLLLDTVVPQDDLYLSTSAPTTTVVVSYGNF